MEPGTFTIFVNISSFGISYLQTWHSLLYIPRFLSQHLCTLMNSVILDYTTKWRHWCEMYFAPENYYREFINNWSFLNHVLYIYFEVIKQWLDDIFIKNLSRENTCKIYLQTDINGVDIQKMLHPTKFIQTITLTISNNPVSR